MKVTTILAICLILVFVFGGVDMFVKYIKERNIECREMGIDNGCGDYYIQCAVDCKKLNQEYFKYRQYGFGNSECICHLNNELKTIW